MSARRTYSTDAIAVHWESARCIHTGICLNALPQVFDTRRRPWVEIEGADADAVADAVERCPTGALRYERLDGRPGEQPLRPTLVMPIADGPLLLLGDLLVEDPEGNEITREQRLTLCRCGRTRNQPFCDNTHLRRGWESGPDNPPGRALPAPREGASGEPTRIVPLEDGALRITGHVVLCDPSGRPVAEAGRAILCRCGQSANKPYCDSSHEDAGFRSEAPEASRDRLEAETPAAFTPNRRVPDPQAVEKEAG